MQTHPADCLRGPVRRTPGTWPEAPEGDIRWELVERVRQEIAEGTYDTEEKLEKALQRLFEELQ